MHCITVYREHEAETNVVGPFDTRTAAVEGMQLLARRIAERRPIDQIVGVMDDLSMIVYDAEYDAAQGGEPTDDDYHVTLEVQPVIGLDEA